MQTDRQYGTLVLHNQPCVEHWTCDDGVVFFHERAGVISPKPAWIAFAVCRMFNGDTIEDALADVYENWNSERNLVG